MSALTDGLEDLGLNLPTRAIVNLELFLQELERWNRVHNLTAITGENDSISLHLLDSIAILPKIVDAIQTQQGSHARLADQPFKIADLGSGGGLPGIPLAIVMPEWHFSLIEKVRKKTAFLQHLKGKLQLNNIEILAKRAEQASLTKAGCFDAVISRAFTNLADFLRLAEPFLNSTGLVFAMKARLTQTEMSAVAKDQWRLVSAAPVFLPNRSVERHLLTFARMRKSFL